MQISATTPPPPLSQKKKGRHPLQELIIDDEFIANDTKIYSSDRRINVITGPNFSGKSCYARQCGVLVYMSQIGSFLPCDSATVSVTDQILAVISSVETCSVPQSSFQLDLTRMASVLRRSTPRTLVLIDEFGKGTAPSSGIAVLTAALKHLSSRGCGVVCTTHFLEMFSLGLLRDRTDGIRAYRMAVHVPSSRSESDHREDGDNRANANAAVPLFALEDGVAESSAGLVCARMAGVREDVLSRAGRILDALRGEGDPVRPVPWDGNSNSALQPAARSVLRHFLGVGSWADADEGEMVELQRRVMRM